jgi:hypothetical protein
VGQPSHDGETEPGAGEVGQVQGLGGDGLLGALQGDVAHDESAVLDGDDDARGRLLDVDVHLGGGRAEVRRVVHEFGQRVHDALGGVAGHGQLARGVQPDALVAADAPHRAAQDALHDDGLGPAPPGAGAGQHGDGVRETSRLRGAVVQVEQVAEDFLVGVPVLHLPQVGRHARGQRLYAARRVGARRHRRGAHSLAPVHLVGQGVQYALMGAVGNRRHGGESRLRGGAGAQPLDKDRDDDVREVRCDGPFGVGVGSLLPDDGTQPARHEDAARGEGHGDAQYECGGAAAPGDARAHGLGRRVDGEQAGRPRDEHGDQQGESGARPSLRRSGRLPGYGGRGAVGRAFGRWRGLGGHQSGSLWTGPGREGSEPRQSDQRRTNIGEPSII